MWRSQLVLIPRAAFLCLLLWLAGLSKSIFPQENHCDPQLRQSTDDPYGYRLRNDRCEGIYIREVASTPLLVASLTESVEDFDLTVNQNLVVEWTAPGPASADIHLRALALRHRLYYRMDTIRAAGSASYVWPPNLLATLNLHRSDLGIVAWTSYVQGNTKRDVYLPLRIRQQGAANKSHGYQLTLLPGVDLAEVFVSLAPTKPDGSPGAFIKKDQALGYGYYPAERGITLSIPELKTPGVYYLEIGATLRDGSSSTAQVWFYHRN